MFLLPILSALASAPSTVAIVPGCPALEDGRISHCQQRRVAWVLRLWEQGLFSHVITSGAAVYNPVVEADVMAEALIAMGIPEERILRERDAMHTDQNIAWSLNIAEAHGFDNIVIATDMGQAQHGCAMVRAWSQVPCTAPGMDYRRVRDDLITGNFELPELKIPLLGGWIPLEEREDLLAKELGVERRPSSFFLYLSDALDGKVKPRPTLPPVELRTPTSQPISSR
jgi:hypothetical protein